MIELTKENFEAEVLSNEGSVIVDFYGDGCLACAALKPHYAELSEKYGDRVKICALNTSKARKLAITQGIMGLPTVVAYVGGKAEERLIKDEASPENVEELIKKHIG